MVQLAAAVCARQGVRRASQAHRVLLTLFDTSVDVWYPCILKHQPHVLPTTLDACRQRQPGLGIDAEWSPNIRKEDCRQLKYSNTASRGAG
jgi:hypothetical protein